MTHRRKYNDFTESEPYNMDSKYPPYSPRRYVKLKCPHCLFEFSELALDSLKANRSARIKTHLKVCPAYIHPPCDESSHESKKQKTAPVDSGLVTIYKLVYLPDNRAVYTGRTKDPERRLAQHASASSKCRLVRNAMRRYGRAKFAIEPILRCKPEDADANESYYIMANNTLHPNGYNLRHGSAAGDESEEEHRIVESASGVVPFDGIADELAAQGEAHLDLAEICEDIEDCSATEEVCRQLLMEVNPDRAGERLFTATEVAGMLNQVRETVKS